MRRDTETSYGKLGSPTCALNANRAIGNQITAIIPNIIPPPDKDRLLMDLKQSKIKFFIS